MAGLGLLQLMGDRGHPVKDIRADVGFLNTSPGTATRDIREKQTPTKTPPLSSALVPILDEKGHTLGWTFTYKGQRTPNPMQTLYLSQR